MMYKYNRAPKSFKMKYFRAPKDYNMADITQCDVSMTLCLLSDQIVAEPRFIFHWKGFRDDAR
jgi:hypothetical protein